MNEVSSSPDSAFKRQCFKKVAVTKPLRDLLPQLAPLVKNEDQSKALYGYSPYHQVTKGTNYPAILMTTGVNDDRVAPALKSL